MGLSANCTKLRAILPSFTSNTRKRRQTTMVAERFVLKVTHQNKIHEVRGEDLENVCSDTLVIHRSSYLPSYNKLYSDIFHPVICRDVIYNHSNFHSFISNLLPVISIKIFHWLPSKTDNMLNHAKLDIPT